MLDLKALSDAVFKSVEGYVGKAFAQLSSRMDGFDKALKEFPAPMQGVKGDAGPPGAPGVDGKDGAHGEDVDPAAVAALLLPGLRKTMEGWPRPQDGAPGSAGPQGEAGAPGKDADPAAVAAVLWPDVLKTVEAWPRPQDGHDGKDGADGKNGEHGKSVTVDEVLPAFEVLMTKALLDFERRSMDVLQRAIDRMPVPKDGRDGMGVEDMQAEHDGDGNITLRFARGEVAKEFKFHLPRFKDCGVYREAERYQRGDGVTWGGSFWIAQKDAPQGKPGTPDCGWRLAVKAGRDGKSFDTPAPAAGVVRIK